MSDMLNSNLFVRALGLALVHFVWQGAAVWFAVAVSTRIASRSSTRYAVAATGLLTLAALPMATTAYYYGGNAPGILTPSPVTEGVSPSSAAASVASSPAAWLPLVVLVWSTGVLVLAMRLAAQWASARRLRRTSQIDQMWMTRARDVASRLGLRRDVGVATTSRIEVPAVLGWLRPIILLPATALAGLTPAMADAILAHELAHVRRHDYLVNTLQHAVETLLFYHPGVWWVSARMREERESCCDEIAAGICGSRVEYARALVALEARRMDAPTLAVAATSGDLLSRIRHLLGHGRPEGSPVTWVTSMLTVGAMLYMTVGGAQASANPLSAPSTPDRQQVIAEEPLRVGGAIAAPRKVRDVRPFYPQSARDAGISGAVILSIVIAADGTVRDVEVIRSVPGLADAAAAAVRQWLYEPPGVPMSMTVSVDFLLSNGTVRVEGSPSPRNSQGSTATRFYSPTQFYSRSTVPAPQQQQVSAPPPRQAVRAPRVIRPVKAAYPEQARASGLTGTVVVEAVVREDGTVGEVRVQKSLSESYGLDDAAVAAARQWRFAPAEDSNGRPVAAVVLLVFEFSLERF